MKYVIADKLLDKGGRILLGPDVDPNSGAGQNSYSTEEFWKKIATENIIFKNNYRLVECKKGRSNMIIVLEKNK